MSEKQEKKPLSSRGIEAMKPSKSIISDTGENRVLRVICGNDGTKTFFYRYTVEKKCHKWLQIWSNHLDILLNDN